VRWNRVLRSLRLRHTILHNFFALILPLFVLAHASFPGLSNPLFAHFFSPSLPSVVLTNAALESTVLPDDRFLPAVSPLAPPHSSERSAGNELTSFATTSSSLLATSQPSPQSNLPAVTEVSEVQATRVHLGGISLGIKLQDEGLLVVGVKKISTDDGHLVSPGEEARIHVGDRILTVDSVALDHAERLGELVDRAGNERRPLTLLVRSGEKTRTVQIQPILDPEDNRYKLGLYVRDGASGIGTLTFFDPVSKRFAALGHVILDQDTREPIVPRGGSVAPSTVVSVERGEEGKPGAIRAIFSDGEKIGSVDQNTDFGVFGFLERIPEGITDAPLVPVAHVGEIVEGTAEILTVVQGQVVERFQIEIESVDRERRPTTKGIVFRVTDSRLIERTGGIVQGMSGSPILQNGKLVGAVTHVFVGDPRKGYAVAAEWMLEKGGFTLTKQ